MAAAKAATKFVLRRGARVRGVPPDVLAHELAALNRRGQLSASGVLDAARDEESPLHPAFEWDDDEAAEQFRLIQARALIRAVQIVKPGQAPRSVYVHVARVDAGEGDYQALDAIVSRPDAYALALAQAQRRLSSAQEAVDELHRAATGVKPEEYVARIALAAQALSAAEQAVRALN
jgi:hypothetical protein